MSGHPVLDCDRHADELIGARRLLEKHFADWIIPIPVSMTVDVFLGRHVMLSSGSIFTLAVGRKTVSEEL